MGNKGNEGNEYHDVLPRLNHASQSRARFNVHLKQQRGTLRGIITSCLTVVVPPRRFARGQSALAEPKVTVLYSDGD